LQLSALVDKSLLRRTNNVGYEIHEMLRQYAAEKLADHPAEWKTLNARFATYFLNLVRLRQKQLIGYSQKQVLREFGREIENIRAAWHWAVENGEWEKIFNALGMLEFFDIRGLPVEAEELFGTALNHLKAAQTLTPQMETILALVLAGYAWFGTWVGYISQEDARRLLEESIALSEKYGNKKELAFGYLALGHNYQFGYEVEKAENLYRRSYALYVELSDLYWTGNALGAMAMIADLRGDYTTSYSLYQEMLNISRRIGEHIGCAGALVSLTNVARLQGNFEAARKYAEEAVLLYRDLTQPDRLSNALANLGLVYKALGDYDAAAAVLEESRHLCESLKFEKGLLAALMNNIGILARLRGSYEEAVQIHRQSIAMFKEVNSLWGQGFSQNDLGSALLAMKKPLEALRLHEDSLRMSRQIGNRYDTADSLQRMGQVYATLEQDEKAEACFKEALQIAYEIHVVPLMAEILTHLGLLHRSPELLSAAYHASGTEAHIRQCIAALEMRLPASAHSLEETVQSAIRTP
ncbi:MAG: tetratricopeptide repeat protein, partial [Anaerolineae bacterium]|nr:tetratricopeptide repeat protein [Anaerolineae bacterium]